MTTWPEIKLFGFEESSYVSAVKTIVKSSEVRLTLNEGSEQQAFEDVLLGRIAGTVLPAAFFAGRAPTVVTAELPFLLSGREEAYRYWDGTYREELNQELSSQHLKVLAVFDGGERHIFSRGRAIKTPDDFSERHFRVMPNSLLVQALEKLHATVHEIPGSDFSRAMTDGEFDSCDRSISNFFEYEMEHYFDHVSLTAHTVAATLLVVHSSAVSAISADPEFSDRLREAERQQRLSYAISDREKFEELRKIVSVHVPDRSRFREVFHELLIGYSPKLGWEVTS